MDYIVNQPVNQSAAFKAAHWTTRLIELIGLIVFIGLIGLDLLVLLGRLNLLDRLAIHPNTR